MKDRHPLWIPALLAALALAGCTGKNSTQTSMNTTPPPISATATPPETTGEITTSTGVTGTLPVTTPAETTPAMTPAEAQAHVATLKAEPVPCHVNPFDPQCVPTDETGEPTTSTSAKPPAFAPILPVGTTSPKVAPATAAPCSTAPVPIGPSSATGMQMCRYCDGHIDVCPKTPPAPPSVETTGNCITTNCGNLGTATGLNDINSKYYAGSGDPIMYFAPDPTGAKGKVFNYWFLKNFPSGYVMATKWLYGQMGGALETCAGAGFDIGRCTHRMSGLGIYDRVPQKLYQPGMTGQQYPGFDATHFNVRILNNGYKDARGSVSAAVIQAALNVALANTSAWGDKGRPCPPPWPCK